MPFLVTSEYTFDNEKAIIRFVIIKGGSATQADIRDSRFFEYTIKMKNIKKNKILEDIYISYILTK